MILAPFQGNFCNSFLKLIFRNFCIFLFFLSFCRHVVEPLKGKFSDISRPINESFRHTGHGSVIGGASWGNPTTLDPAYLCNDQMNVELRQSPTSKDRKKKCVSEQYVRERKSNANKQFAYNKLKNEKQMSLKHEQKSSAAPKRPPQIKLPKFEGKEKEGMLIDLSPPQQYHDNNVASKSNNQIGKLMTNMNISILDAPIDVPTEGQCTNNAIELNTVDLFGSTESSKIEPPPYQAPPTYMNTYGISQSYASTSNVMDANLRSLDPFDTSHIIDQTVKSNNLMQRRATSSQPNSSYNSNESLQQLNSSIDSNRSKSPAQLSAGTLSDSMKVNLSSLTLHDADDETKHSISTEDIVNSFGRNGTNTKIDKSFLAELEKEIYKNEFSISNLNMNMLPHHSAKENSVSAISSEVYGASHGSMNCLHNETIPSPLRMSSMSLNASTKYMNSQVKSTNEEIAYSKSNYESTSSSASNDGAQNYYTTSLNKKQYNKEMSGSNAWMDQAMIVNAIDDAAPNQGIYSNFSSANSTYSISNKGSTATDQKHNFVAVSNRPVLTVNLQQQQINNTRATTNIYNSVTSDIYGSITSGNIYDIVAAPHSANTSNYYGTIPDTPRNNSNDYYEAITTTNEFPSVIYDEVAGDDLLRPHRPAPIAPPVLSAQQIQRRLERAQQGQQQIYSNLEQNFISNDFIGSNTPTAATNQQKVFAFIKEVSHDGEVTEQEARQALLATNWDHGLAVRHFKIERLLR